MQSKELYENGYSNESTQLLINWQNSRRSNKSNLEVDRLVCNVLHHPRFSVQDLENFNARRENQLANKFAKKLSHLQFFTETSVPIDVPLGSKNIPSKTFHVPGLYYRKLVNVICATFKSPLADKFHYNPFKLYRHSSGDNGIEQ